MAILFGGLIVTVCVVGAETYGVPAPHLLRDFAAVGELPAYTGLFSQLGLFLWSGSLALLLFSRSLAVRDYPEWTSFLNYLSALTLLLLLDDAFMFHERVLPDRVGDLFTALLYGGSVAVLILLFYDRLLQSPYPLLVSALACLGFAVLFDLVPGPERFISPTLCYVLEDGVKLIGIFLWASYYFATCRQLLRRAPARDVDHAASVRQGQLTHGTTDDTFDDGGLSRYWS